jgi:Cupin-like domain
MMDAPMTMPAFDDHARAVFGSIYPETPAILTHNLVGHPLFTLEALIELANRMDPVHVEYNRADLPIGTAPEDVKGNGLSIVDTIRSIEENGSWMVLKFVEKDAVYKALLDQVLDEIAPIAAQKTGNVLKREAFIFVSSPGSVTPFHFDPEHNILLQLRGTKTMMQFPAGDEEIVPGVEHERFHMGGHRNLPWHEAFDRKAIAFPLEPGQAVYVPVKAPHWVQNGPELSVSFSITWRSEWSFAEEDARSLNHLLRKAGLIPAEPKRFPHQNTGKSTAYRVIRKIGLGQ